MIFAHHMCIKLSCEWILDMYQLFSPRNSYSNQLCSLFWWGTSIQCTLQPLQLWQDYKYSSQVPPKRERVTDRNAGYCGRYPFWIVCGFFTIPQKCCETESMVYHPHPRRLESLTICRCQIQRQHFVLSRLKTVTVGLTRVWTHNLLCSSLMINQLSKEMVDRMRLYWFLRCITQAPVLQCDNSTCLAVW